MPLGWYYNEIVVYLVKRLSVKWSYSLCWSIHRTEWILHTSPRKVKSGNLPSKLDLTPCSCSSGAKYEATSQVYTSDSRLSSDTLEGCAAVHWDLNRLEKWIGKSPVKLSRKKCKVLYLGRSNPVQQYKLEANQLECSFAEREFCILE